MTEVPSFANRVRRRARTLFDQYYNIQSTGRRGDALNKRVRDLEGLLTAHADADRLRWPDFNQQESFKDEMERIEKAGRYLDQRRTWTQNNLTVPILDDAYLLPQRRGQLRYRYSSFNNRGQLDWTAVDYDDSNNVGAKETAVLGLRKAKGFSTKFKPMSPHSCPITAQRCMSAIRLKSMTPVC